MHAYRKQFKKVFRTEFISPEHILKALAQFTGYMTSANSKYDRYKKGSQLIPRRKKMVTSYSRPIALPAT